MVVLMRIFRWLRGIPSADALDERRHLDAERERAQAAAIVEAGRSNLAGGKGAGPGGRDWTQWG